MSRNGNSTTDGDTSEPLSDDPGVSDKVEMQREYSFPVRNVKTPVWVKDTDVTSHYTKSESVQCMSHDEMSALHWQCEVLERRINRGRDKEHNHPAMVVEILKTTGVRNITEHEYNRRKRYDNQICREALPDFWQATAPRPWDGTFFKTLTKKESENLQEDIKQCHKYRNRHTRGARWMSSEDDYSDSDFDPDTENDRPRPQMITRSRRRQLGITDEEPADTRFDPDLPRDTNRIIHLSTKMFETDDELELTDNEVMDYY